MKAITLTQPWATLVAIGAKKIETRSWATHYRGPLAIHAGKRLSGMTELQFQALCSESPFEAPLINELGYSVRFSRLVKQTGRFETPYPPTIFRSLPRGQVIAIVDLVDCFEFDGTNDPPEPEYSFGDYTPGRYGWRLENVRRIEPVTVKGALGLWEWKEAA